MKSFRSLGHPAKAIVVILTLFPLYWISFHFRKYASFPSFHSDFTTTWLNNSLLGPFDPEPIRAHCKAVSKWRPNLIFKLDESNGGIGNVRAHVLDFALFAIEAGASMVLPQMTVRSTSDLFDVWHGSQANFSRMFDEDEFRSKIKEACPQLKIYTADEVQHVGVIGELSARSRRTDEDASNTPQAGHDHVTGWMMSLGIDPRSESQMKVTMRHTMWEFDTLSLGSDFRKNFGQLFPFRSDTRRYAALAVQNIASHHDIHIDPSDNLHEGAYYGAHLRTEQDTVSAGWFNPNTATEVGLNYTEQTDAYLAHAAENGLGVMYVATGNATELSRFKHKAASANPPVQVTSKWDLLPAEEAAALGELDWDQQALVDMEILMRCSIFGGFAKSSFAFAIAVARNAWLEAEGRPLGYGWRVREVEPLVAFDDGVSRILGRNELNEKKVPRGAWP